MQQGFRHAIIIVFSGRIKPNCGFKTRCRFTLSQLSSQLTGRRQNNSFSFRFGKLALNLLRVRADDKKSAMCELSRDCAREIGVSGMGR
jgi:hypothetical protein